MGVRIFLGIVLSCVFVLLLWPFSGHAESEDNLQAADYYLHLCERGRHASSALWQERAQTVVIGQCGTHNVLTTLLFRLECPSPQHAGIAVPYTGSSYQVILKTCGDTLYGVDAAPTLREYAEAYQLAFAWENLQTVRKFSVVTYLEHLNVKLLSTSGILKRIRDLSLSSHTSVEILEREKQLAKTICKLYSLAFRLLEKNTA